MSTTSQNLRICRDISGSYRLAEIASSVLFAMVCRENRTQIENIFFQLFESYALRRWDYSSSIILYSREFSRPYIGLTDNLSARVRRHNAGSVPSTRPFRPWVKIHSESFQTRSEAMVRERWFKSGAGRKRVQVIAADFLTKCG